MGILSHRDIINKKKNIKIIKLIKPKCVHITGTKTTIYPPIAKEARLPQLDKQGLNS